jgi:hypothetical protein
MDRLNKTVKINPQLTAQDWNLFSFDKVKSDAGAKALNEELMQAVNFGKPTCKGVGTRMWSKMSQYRSLGATNLEAKRVLVQILIEVFGSADEWI